MVTSQDVIVLELFTVNRLDFADPQGVNTVFGCHDGFKLQDITWDKKTLLYTRRPVTGHVGTHTVPHPNLPAITPPTSLWRAVSSSRTERILNSGQRLRSYIYILD